MGGEKREKGTLKRAIVFSCGFQEFDSAEKTFFSVDRTNVSKESFSDVHDIDQTSDVVSCYDSLRIVGLKRCGVIGENSERRCLERKLCTIHSFSHFEV